MYEKIIESEDGIITNLDIHSEWKSILKTYRIMYVGGITGLGKTNQVMFFAKSKYGFYKCINCLQENLQIVDDIEDFICDVKKRRAKSLLIIDDLQKVHNNLEK